MSDARVWRSLDEVVPAPSALTIGFFDGVHRGHRSIIARATRDAQTRSIRSVAVTFDRHPMEIVRPGTQPPLLTSLERRVRLLLDAGADHVLVLPFTRELSERPPEGFVDEVLVGRLNAQKVVVGTNFRFGHQAAGDVAMLADLGAARGFEVEAVSLLHLGDVPISSTEVRERLADGDVGWAAEALGRPHVLEGPVVRGDQRGRELGVPTLNVAVDPGMAMPANGVYAGHVELHRAGGERVPAVTSVGTRPTFGGDAVTVEAHLIDRNEDLYGVHVGVEFEHRLRDELAFERVDDLVSAMREDIRRGRELLGS